ncbi:MAG: hypothetical protein EBQ89_07480 [Alphaproteobacteria bacterium]|nr:hypothetical protein [Alphaproteobacteria bacterium]
MVPAERTHPMISAIALWLDALRAHQWSKNFLLFIPFVLAHEWGRINALQNVAFVFIIFCAIASATYILNDLMDKAHDQNHPTKKFRAIASGRIGEKAACWASALLLGASGFVVYVYFPDVLLIIVAYVSLTLAYSLSLKKIPLLDCAVIGLLFTLRLIAGTLAADVSFSVWLISFSILFFFSLALVKRHSELMKTKKAGEVIVHGRHYIPNDWPLTLVFGVALGIASTIVLMLYVAEFFSGSAYYQHPLWLLMAPVAVLMWFSRIWPLAHHGRLDDDPVKFALTDLASLALGVLTLTGFILAH